MAFAVLGLEGVALVVGGVILGQRIDTYLGSGTATLVCLLVALVVWFLHFFVMLRAHTLGKSGLNPSQSKRRQKNGTK